LTISLGLSFLLLFLALQNSFSIREAERVMELRKRKADLIREVAFLRSEVSSLSSFARISEKARELGLRFPEEGELKGDLAFENPEDIRIPFGGRYPVQSVYAPAYKKGGTVAQAR